ncbi:putative late blight resistance protein R1A-3 [Capsicum galapagoense]
MAHASVASLIRTVESLLKSNSPMQSLTCDHGEEFYALHEKISSLEVAVKNFEKNNVSGKMTDLEVEVKEVANIVEQTIQLSVAEVVLANDENLREKAQERLSDSLQQVAEDSDRIWKESTNIKDKGKHASKESTVQEFPSSSRNILNVENNMVGRDDQRERLLNDLTTDFSGEPKVIPIVGMGGIGKTTLAKEVYNQKSILCRFDVHAWATVSQQHNRKEILLGLLRSTIKMDDTVEMKGEAELADMLQKSLKKKRYLIVLDDIWSCEVWDGVRRCFPTEDNAGSRILLTTRNNEVACYADTENLSLRMSIMDQDENWSLFKSAAFSSEALPYEFETVGKQIADEYWESVAKDVKSFLTNDLDEQCSRVLGLSYNHLTSGLKTCLLHFGIFPEDSEIPVKKLMRSWMAEGFLKLENDLEGEAEKCLQELGDRCLVLICKKSLDGTKIRSCKVHDLIYDLCVREIQRGNVFIMNDIVLDSMHEKQPFMRVIGDEIYDCYFGFFKVLLTPIHRQLRDHDNNNLLKRTHSIFSFQFEDSSFPRILSLIWLRYLSLQCRKNLDIPPEIFRLWNLQTFIFQGYPYSPKENNCPVQIWGLMQLRHIKLQRCNLPDCPSGSVDKGRHMGFSNLKTISYLSSHCCTKEVIMGIQNVKELGIREGKRMGSNGLLNNLVHLQQLETLNLTFCSSRLLPASAKAFPETLKKLKLEKTYLCWSYLDIIAELPNLEVLKLMISACVGSEWYPNVRGFTRLKVLIIEDNHLNYWKATNDNFPVLERLVLNKCHNLKEIPIEFAEIHTLQLIELTSCLPELGESAARIQQEQEDIGNNPVDVRISDSFQEKK